jgi:hypothetical protein
MGPNEPLINIFRRWTWNSVQLISVCFFLKKTAFAAAVNHHPPNHHPDVECHQNSDCTDPCADATESRVCLNHKCECQATPIGKRFSYIRQLLVCSKW